MRTTMLCLLHDDKRTEQKKSISTRSKVRERKLFFFFLVRGRVIKQKQKKIARGRPWICSSQTDTPLGPFHAPSTRSCPGQEISSFRPNRGKNHSTCLFTIYSIFIGPAVAPPPFVVRLFVLKPSKNRSTPKHMVQ